MSYESINEQLFINEQRKELLEKRLDLLSEKKKRISEIATFIDLKGLLEEMLAGLVEKRLQLLSGKKLSEIAALEELDGFEEDMLKELLGEHLQLLSEKEKISEIVSLKEELNGVEEEMLETHLAVQYCFVATAIAFTFSIEGSNCSETLRFKLYHLLKDNLLVHSLSCRGNNIWTLLSWAHIFLLQLGLTLNLMAKGALFLQDIIMKENKGLNNCVGKKNYRKFFTLMISTLLLLVIQWSTGIVVLICCLLDHKRFIV
ncbi:hypothetical protein L1987_02718 [Smallanthus sonchifolius]|uniref:Uncharacterized protein n=1 Tax=Smallanthus sonchifolius TaxID=185202 RepID=A0ACB9K8P7_9ASTR|nr:hypothetical protein L1987_02718 [Smallanthus sonchifolius]